MHFFFFFFSADILLGELLGHHALPQYVQKVNNVSCILIISVFLYQTITEIHF